MGWEGVGGQRNLGKRDTQIKGKIGKGKGQNYIWAKFVEICNITVMGM